MACDYLWLDEVEVDVGKLGRSRSRSKAEPSTKWVTDDKRLHGLDVLVVD